MEAITVAALGGITSLFFLVFIGVPCAIITHGSLAGMIPIIAFGAMTALFLFIEMFIFILDL